MDDLPADRRYVIGDGEMIARILCLIILLLEIRGLSLSITDRKWMILIFYTQLSNLVTTASALFLLIIGQPYFVTVLRYLSTCMLVMTFLVTTCVLIPMGGNPRKLLWSGNGLYHHVLCPVISTASYILAENHAGRNLIWLPAMITLVYGLVMLYLNWVKKVDGPYPFFRVHNQSVIATVLWMAVLSAAVSGISTVVWFLAR